MQMIDLIGLVKNIMEKIKIDLNYYKLIIFIINL